MKLCESCHNGFYGAPTTCPVCTAAFADENEVTGQELAGMRVSDRYELVELLGEGAMGWVYRGRHVALDRSVAIKLLKTVGDAQPEMVARFEQEARAVSRLHHPHIVSVIDFGRTPGGIFHLVTEFVSGSNLGELLVEEGPLPLQRTLGVFHQILAAVEEAHSQHVIHRDLKPENIVLTPLRSGDDFVKVLDFGIATLADEPGSRLTAAGAFAGTPGYMAPETIREGLATERSDIYALGNVLFELLTGRSLFVHDWPMALLSLHLNEPPPRFTDVAPELGLPESMERVLARMVAKQPADRPGSVAELRTELFDAARQMGRVRLACDRCARPRDPYSGLCTLHGPRSRPAPLVSEPAPRPVGAGTHPTGASSAAGASSSASSRSSDSPPPSARSVPDGTSRTLVHAARPHREALIDRACASDPFGRRGGTGQVVDFLLGNERLLEVAGDEGSGRRYLLEAAAVVAESLDMRTHRLEPDHRLALRPWFPVRRLVGELLGCGPEPAAVATVIARAEACALSPQITEGLSMLFGFGGDEAAEPGPERQRVIHESVARLIAKVEDESTGSCVIVHGALGFDRATQGLVRALPGLLARRQVRVVTSSEGGTLASHKSRVVVRPEPVDADAVSLLLDRAESLGDADKRALAQRIVELSGGNAFHAEQIVVGYTEGVRIDGSVQELVGRRVERLPEDARKLLHAACALGRHAPIDLAGACCAEDVRLLAADLLLRRGMVVADGARRLSPSHGMLARLVLDALGPAERRRLHADLFRALEQVGASAFLLAHHGFEADEEGSSFRWLVEAAELAMAWSDHETAALVHYRRAAHVARWQLLLAEDDPRQLKLSVDMADALLTAGHLASAEVVLKGVLGAAVGDRGIEARASLSLARLEEAQRNKH